MKALVTGATGFVGRALVPVLKAAGMDVFCSTREPSAAIDGCSMRVVGELGPETDWSGALKDIDLVVHLAARVHVMNETSADPLAENMRINTEGTARLARQAAGAGVSRFLFLSTVKAQGENTTGSAFQETDTPDPQDPYGIAKLKAEEGLSGIGAETGMEIVILRPPLVYGPGVGGNFLSLLRLCTKGLPLPLGAVHNRRDLIFVGNLAHAIKTALTHHGAAGKTYFVRDGEGISTTELIRRLCVALDAPTRLLPFPAYLMRLAGQITGNKAVVSRILESLEIDDTAIRQDLDWTPPYNMLQGLSQTAEWFKART